LDTKSDTSFSLDHITRVKLRQSQERLENGKPKAIFVEVALPSSSSLLKFAVSHIRRAFTPYHHRPLHLHGFLFEILETKLTATGLAKFIHSLRLESRQSWGKIEPVCQRQLLVSGISLALHQRLDEQNYYFVSFPTRCVPMSQL
jgi:hypothetical protein